MDVIVVWYYVIIANIEATTGTVVTIVSLIDSFNL